MTTELDDVDRGILYLLQRDARNVTGEEMGEAVGVSASTVRNRIERMEAEDIIRGYHPDIDYDKAGLQLHVVIICSVPNRQRDALAENARDVRGVIMVQEVLNGEDNLHIEAVGTDTDDIARITDELTELGIDVINSKILKSIRLQPFDHFGRHLVDDDDPEAATDE